MNFFYLPLLLMSLLFLSACDKIVSIENKIQQTRDIETFMLTVKITDETKIKQVCSDLGVQYEANGCATYNFDTNHCVIYVMPQRYTEDSQRLEIIGHELWHCRFGQWHQ